MDISTIHKYESNIDRNNPRYITDGMGEIQRNLKRIIDFFTSGICLIVFSPLFLICYIAVKREDGGPAIFKQERIGRFGRPFYIYKFRSMRTDAEKDGPALFRHEKETRLTKTGKFLREHHLDELPQLWNVFKGEMAFIGPRPILTYHPCKYEEYTEEEKTVFSVRPGISGWAQVNGRNSVDWEERFKLNEWYVQHVSLWLDIKIVFMTIAQVFSRKEIVIQGETAKTFKERHQEQ